MHVEFVIIEGWVAFHSRGGVLVEVAFFRMSNNKARVRPAQAVEVLVNNP